MSEKVMAVRRRKNGLAMSRSLLRVHTMKTTRLALKAVLSVQAQVLTRMAVLITGYKSCGSTDAGEIF